MKASALFKETGSPPDRLVLVAEVVLVFAAAWYYLYTLQFENPIILGYDGWYHVKMAWLIRTEGVMDTFPWVVHSIWADRFYDKELGFHLLLMPFTFGDLVTGGKLAAVTFSSVFVASFYLVLRLQGVRWALFWTLLLLASGRFFGYRLHMPRPHLLSMIFSLWALFAVLRRSWKSLAVISVAYAFSYVAPIVAVFYAGIYWAVSVWRERAWNPALPLAALGGIVLGWVIHPHFPNNFVHMWINLVNVIGGAWGIGETGLQLGMEMRAADRSQFIANHLVVIAALGAAVWTFARMRDKRDPAILTLAIISVGYFVLALQSKRFVEYWVPLSIWVSALVIDRGARESESIGQVGERPRFLRRVLQVGLGVAVLAMLSLSQQGTRSSIARQPVSRERGALWLAERAPRDDLVFTCDWDDSPGLFFFNHRNRYMVILDPNYMYRWKPDIWTLWRGIKRGDHEDPAGAIRDELGARFGFCTREYTNLRTQLLSDPRVKVRVWPGYGYAFEIDP